VRAVVQRVREAQVAVAGEVVGAIGHGLCVLVGVAAGDSTAEAELLSRKVVALRVFDDEAGQMNRSLDDVRGALLAAGGGGRGRASRGAAPAPLARALYDHFVGTARAMGTTVETGRFQAHMTLALVNDGPVTLLLDTAELRAA
jgi:D-tyrosyl-tRNA(Tyr) deacylase